MGSGIVLGMRAVPTVVPIPDNSQSEGEQSIGRAFRRQRWQLRQRANSCIIAAGTGSATLAWEGPYLRIYPHTWNAEGKTFSGRVWDPGATASVNSVVGGTMTADTRTSFYYECDACNQPPIYFPFDASVSLFGTRTRGAMYDVLVNDPGPEDEDPKVDMRDALQELTLTRLCLNGQSRLVEVPPGCNEYSLIGAAPTAITLGFETTPKAGSQVVQLFSGAGLRRYAIGGACNINIDATGAASPVGVVFWVKLR